APSSWLAPRPDVYLRPGEAGSDRAGELDRPGGVAVHADRANDQRQLRSGVGAHPAAGEFERLGERVLGLGKHRAGPLARQEVSLVVVPSIGEPFAVYPHATRLRERAHRSLVGLWGEEQR